MKLFDGQANHPMTVRLFALERKGLTFDVHSLDVANLENRRLAYRQVNPRGEVPALQLDDGTIITEVTAICEYFDEIAQGGKSLYGETAAERAQTRMWLRRMDLEIAQPVISWFRNDPATIDFYQGNRLVSPESRVVQKVQINQALNRLEDELEGRTWLCGDRFSAADVHFYGLMKFMVMEPCPWVLLPGRKNVVAYFERFDKRDAAIQSMTPFSGRMDL